MEFYRKFMKKKRKKFSSKKESVG